MPGNILIVDDEKGQRDILSAILLKEGYSTSVAQGGKEALEKLRGEEFDLILTDLKMQGMSGLELLEAVLAGNPRQCVILMTAHGTIDSAVEAMKMGAFDYLEKPLDRDELLLTLQRAFERVLLLRENRALHKRLEEDQGIPAIIGDHPKMKEIFRIINKISPTGSTVLIYGESGTGKELVARAIHDNSPRKDKPFFAINCAAIPEPLMESELFGHEKGSFTGAGSREIGLFEMANHGTVFLDEIGEMSISMQAKLLRVIQEKEIRRVGGKVNIAVDVRILSATNRDLEAEIRKGSFRDDLYYRLNVIRINLPPLRERGTDIAALADFFVRKCATAGNLHIKGISRAAMKILMNYSWPGNVRQLESIIERGALMAESDFIEPEDIPAEIHGQLSLGGTVRFELPPEGISIHDLEREIIISAMDRADWIIAKAAPLLGISYKTLQYRLEKFGIERPGKV